MKIIGQHLELTADEEENFKGLYWDKATQEFKLVTTETEHLYGVIAINGVRDV